MQGYEGSIIVGATRRGPLIILTAADGHRLAVRDTSIRAIDETVETGTCRLVFSSGEQLSVDADLDTVISWLTVPRRQR